MKLFCFGSTRQLKKRKKATTTKMVNNKRVSSNDLNKQGKKPKPSAPPTTPMSSITTLQPNERKFGAIILKTNSGIPTNIEVKFCNC